MYEFDDDTTKILWVWLQSSWPRACMAEAWVLYTNSSDSCLQKSQTWVLYTHECLYSWLCTSRRLSKSSFSERSRNDYLLTQYMVQSLLPLSRHGDRGGSHYTKSPEPELSLSSRLSSETFEVLMKDSNKDNTKPPDSYSKHDSFRPTCHEEGHMYINTDSQQQ